MNRRLDRHIWFKAVLMAISMANASPAAAQQKLSQDEHVTRVLVSAAIGEDIRNNCSGISGRMFRVYSKAKKLERYARDQGYTEAQVNQFLRSKTQQSRIIGLARTYMVENGVVEGQEATYCSLGRAEIAKGTLTGFLLFAW